MLAGNRAQSVTCENLLSTAGMEESEDRTREMGNSRKYARLLPDEEKYNTL